MPFVIGETVGPYRLTEQLGQGGMATVFKAYHAALDRYVAIKVLHLAFMEDPSFLARFQREARVVARLDHPHIVPIYDFAEHEGRPYLVMKFIEGDTLKARLEQGRLPQSEILRIIETMGAALDYAHQQNVLHRDIKPSNVLVAQDNHLYLTDFGLARMAEMGESSLTADRMVGTPQYMSPEQALSKPNLDARSDIYSFGVMMYEMLVGRVPYNADTPFAIIHDHIYTPLPLPREVNPDIPAPVERVLLKALAKDPLDRFASMSRLIEAYRAAVTPGGEDLLAGEVGLDATHAAPSLFSTSAPAPAPAAEPAAKVSVSLEADAPKKRRPKGWVLGCGISALVITVLCLFMSLRALIMDTDGFVTQVQTGQAMATSINHPDFNPESLLTLVPGEFDPEAMATLNVLFEENGSQTPAPSVSPSPPISSADREAALATLHEAITAWDQGNPQKARELLNKMREQAAGDVDVYEQGFQVVRERNAWALGAMILLDKERRLPGDLVLLKLPAAHEIVFEAAKDPAVKDVFERNADDPLLTAARIRYVLHHGRLETAQQELEKALKTPKTLRDFPEIQLVEAELYIKQGDAVKAQKTLEQLLKNPDLLPPWLQKRAEETQKGLQ